MFDVERKITQQFFSQNIEQIFTLEKIFGHFHLWTLQQSDSSFKRIHSFAALIKRFSSQPL